MQETQIEVFLFPPRSSAPPNADFPSSEALAAGEGALKGLLKVLCARPLSMYNYANQVHA